MTRSSHSKRSATHKVPKVHKRAKAARKATHKAAHKAAHHAAHHRRK